MVRILIALSFLLAISCGQGPSGPQYDLKGFDTESIGGGATFVSYKDQSGKVLTQGQVLNGVRTGTWATFHDDNNQIKTLTNYINGKKNGMLLAVNDRGQIETRTDYKDDVLHGLLAKYSFGRMIEETRYADGVLHGAFTICDKNGKVQRKGEFKNGKQHGLLQYFNESGELTLEYEYKNGEKIGGGIIEKKQEEVGS